jgi:sugar lactone lactonase YvrE
VCDNPSNPQLARFNDGAPIIWAVLCGHVLGAGDYNGALLMRIDNDLTPKVIQCDIHGHNGLAFSPDKQWMFTSDTPNGVIYRTPLDEQGEPGNERCFVSLKRAKGYRTARRWMWKAATGARCLTAGASRVFHRKGSSWKNIAAGALPDDGLLWRR